MFKTIMDLEEAVQKAKKSRIDTTLQYPENTAGYELQSNLRLSSRALYVEYISETRFTNHKSLKKKDIENILELLSETKSLFGNHPFHHVIDGRIATVVQNANRYEVRIPKRFFTYKEFEINHWNNPFMNYNTPSDIPSRKKSLIPPDWQKNKQ